MNIKPTIQHTKRLSLLAGVLVLLVVCGMGWLSFSKQTLLNDVYATGTCAYVVDGNIDEDVVSIYPMPNITVNNWSTDSLVTKAPLPEKPDASTKHTNSNNEACMFTQFFIQAFNYLQKTGFFNNPF